MDKTDNTLLGNSAPGIVPMAKIDGGEVRRIRESLGLTQLYLATYIGVTTDTVSRWENRRYPAIKLDNAEKLAQALDVELEAILDRENVEGAESAESAERVVDSAQPVERAPSLNLPGDTAVSIDSHRLPPTLWFLLLFLVGVFGTYFWWKARSSSPDMTVVAERILPNHIPLGQAFPVLIRITTSQDSSISLIVKETLPFGCLLVNSEPTLTSADAKSGVVRWISRMDKQEAFFAYQVKTSTKLADDGKLRFGGGVTLNYGDQVQVDIVGDSIVAIAPYHWADVDQNNMIDDEEILAVYDRYSVLSHMDFDRDLIDSIWTANGYLWDGKTGKFVVRKDK